MRQRGIVSGGEEGGRGKWLGWFKWKFQASPPKTLSAMFAQIKVEIVANSKNKTRKFSTHKARKAGKGVSNFDSLHPLYFPPSHSHSFTHTHDSSDFNDTRMTWKLFHLNFLRQLRVLLDSHIHAPTHIHVHTHTHTRGCTMGARSVYCQQSIKTAKSFVTKTYADI